MGMRPLSGKRAAIWAIKKALRGAWDERPEGPDAEGQSLERSPYEYEEVAHEGLFR